LAGIILSKPGISFIGREIKKKFNSKINEKDLIEAVTKMVTEPVELDEIKIPRTTVRRKKSIQPAENKTPKLVVEPINTLTP
jgi:hypothetical protein